MKARNI